MRKNNLLVFDDFVINPQFGGTEAYTSSDLERQLGTYDVVAVQAVMDTWNIIDATFLVMQQHSADAKNWLYQNNGNPVATVVTPHTPGGLPLTSMGADVSGAPALAFVRFQMFWSVGSGNARVRLYATLRDKGT